jgi:hypothetical protein
MRATRTGGSTRERSRRSHSSSAAPASEASIPIASSSATRVLSDVARVSVPDWST